MGIYYCAANMTKREQFDPDFLAPNWGIKSGCVNPEHPFGIAVAMMMDGLWRGDHVVIADDTNPTWAETWDFRRVDHLVRNEFLEIYPDHPYQLDDQSGD